jgi:tRNA 2-thiouridine synthesizing protein E
MLNLQNNEIAIEHPPVEVLDEEGYLIDAHAWEPAFTEVRAEEINLQLTDKHWELIDLIRDKYLRLGAVPPMRSVCKAVGIDRFTLKQQFGSCLTLWKMAGLPNPGEEAKTYMN